MVSFHSFHVFCSKVSNQLPSQPARILPNFCLADSLTNLITRQNPGLWLDKGCPFEGCAPYDLVITGILLDKYGDIWRSRGCWNGKRWWGCWCFFIGLTKQITMVLLMFLLDWNYVHMCFFLPCLNLMTSLGFGKKSIDSSGCSVKTWAKTFTSKKDFDLMYILYITIHHISLPFITIGKPH